MGILPTGVRAAPLGFGAGSEVPICAAAWDPAELSGAGIATPPVEAAASTLSSSCNLLRASSSSVLVFARLVLASSSLLANSSTSLAVPRVGGVVAGEEALIPKKE